MIGDLSTFSQTTASVPLPIFIFMYMFILCSVFLERNMKTLKGNWIYCIIIAIIFCLLYNYALKREFRESLLSFMICLPSTIFLTAAAEKGVTKSNYVEVIIILNYYMACVCSWYNAHSDWLILKHSPVIPEYVLAKTK